MGMTIATNNAALNAYRNLSNTQSKLNSSLQKLSSGFRINNAADDAAGLSISEGLASQISGITQAGRNAQDGISVIQTADGALSEVTSILHRMRDLAVQGANDSNSVASRTAIKTEADDLGKELDRITKNTNFNGIDLLKAGTLNFQVGAGSTADNTITVSLADVATAAGTLSSAAGATGFDVTSNATANTTITAIDTAITAVSTSRADLGASINRFQSAANSLSIAGQNLTAAHAQIKDTDMAAEMVNYTQSSILSQAGTAMLAQANQSGQGILKLLQ